MILHGIIVLALGFLYYRAIGEVRSVLFGLAWAFKVAMGVALGLVYQYYYTSNDTWLFFQDAVKLADLARSDFSQYVRFLFTDENSGNIWQEITNTQVRSLFFVKILSVFTWIGSNNYWVCVLYFSTFSFIASWALFKTVVESVEAATVASALAFLFFPSVVFWSSGIIKETLALAGIFWCSAVMLHVLKNKPISFWTVTLTALSIWVAWNLKYYWAAVFVVVTVTTLLVHFLRPRIEKLNHYPILSWCILFLILSALASLLHPNFYLTRILDVLVDNHNDYVRISRPENLIHYHTLQATWWSVLINAPWALFSGIFRPWIGEAAGITAWAASIENLVLAILVMGLLFRRDWLLKDRMLGFSMLVYIALLGAFLALSTPNLGTLSRYRVGFMPFLVFILTYRNPLLIYLTRKWPFLNR